MTRSIFFLALVLSFQWMNGQTKQISGLVTDSQGAPLPGVSIVEKGTTNGVVTDFDGNYNISVSGSSSVLVFTFIGFKKQELPVGNGTSLNVGMIEDIAALDEVVLVGYGTQRKQDLTGAISSANLDQFKESPNTNVLQSLQGSLPGVSVGQTAVAGAEPNIQIRGRSTLNGSQDPLVVLDGIIYRGRLSDLNPKDIKSVDVLKDPSSKAIYGAQAANGIVIVSTKKGKSSRKPTINYSSFYAVQNPTNDRHTNNRDAYLQKTRDIDWENGYIAPDFTQENPAWTPADKVPFFLNLLAGLQNGTDYNWFNEVTNPGYTTDHQLSISGSSGTTTYFVSGGVTKQKGWMLNDTYGRKTVRVNLDTQVYGWLTIGANIFGAFSDFSGESPNLSVLPQMSPLATPRDENGDLIINPLGDNVVNPFLQSSTDDLDHLNNISAIFYASLDVPQIKGLNYRINFSNNYRWSLEGNSSIYGAGLTGSAFKQNASTYDVSLDNILTYDRRFGNDDHGVKLTFVAGFNNVDYENTRAEGSDFVNLSLSYNSLEQAVNQEVSSDAWEERYSSQTGRLNYDYKRKYLLSASIRRDGFSGFAENNKTALFPSIGLGWVISKESFLANSTVINLFKVRGSYGSNGNLTSRYSSLARIEAPESSRYVFGDGSSTVNGQTVVSLSNPNLKWERTDGINVGLDFGLLDNRISGTVDYYNSTTKDLLWDYILPQLTGFSSIRANIGEIENTGLEFSVNFNPVHTTDFNWIIGGNFSKNRNKIVTLLGQDLDGDGKEDDLVANGLFIGESIGTVYNYQVDGLWQISDEDNIPEGWSPGLQKLHDLDGDGTISAENDRRILGRTEPDYSFGITNSFSYRNFDFRFFINSIQGGKDSYLGRNDPWQSGYNSTGNAQNHNSYTDIDYWTPKNPNATYRVPGILAPIEAARYFDRSFVRLQDISLSYNLGEDVVKKIGMNSLKLFLSGKNLITWTDWEGWDPETGQGLGVSGSALPVMKSITFGLDVSF